MKLEEAPDYPIAPPHLRRPHRVLERARRHGKGLRVRQKAFRRAFYFEKTRAAISLLLIDCCREVRDLVRQSGSAFVNLHADFEKPERIAVLGVVQNVAQDTRKK